MVEETIYFGDICIRFFCIFKWNNRWRCKYQHTTHWQQHFKCNYYTCACICLCDLYIIKKNMSSSKDIIKLIVWTALLEKVYFNSFLLTFKHSQIWRFIRSNGQKNYTLKHNLFQYCISLCQFLIICEINFKHYLKNIYIHETSLLKIN